MSELRIGLVGAGHIAATHVHGWRRSRRARVVALFDLDLDAARRRARELSVPEIAASLDDLLEGCDVVDVCTPPHAHLDIARSALAAGRHLVVEKPIVVTVAEWDELRPQIEAAGRAVGVVHHLQHARAVATARRWLEGGKIGRLLRIDHHFLSDPSGDRMLRADDHWSHGLPGGRWTETLPHALYLAYRFAGRQELESVVATRTATAPSVVRADEVTVLLRGDGTISALHYSANCSLNRRDVVLQGSGGRIEIDLLADGAFLYRSGDSAWRRATTAATADARAALLRWPVDRAGYLLDRLRRQTPHGRFLAAFARQVLDGAPTVTTLDEIDFVVRATADIGEAIEARLP